jgi:hypothetical protein
MGCSDMSNTSSYLVKHRQQIVFGIFLPMVEDNGFAHYDGAREVAWLTPTMYAVFVLLLPAFTLSPLDVPWRNIGCVCRRSVSIRRSDCWWRLRLQPLKGFSL